MSGASSSIGNSAASPPGFIPSSLVLAIAASGEAASMMQQPRFVLCDENEIQYVFIVVDMWFLVGCLSFSIRLTQRFRKWKLNLVNHGF